MLSDVQGLVQKNLFVRKTRKDYQSFSHDIDDEDTAFKKLVIGEGTSSTDLFDFSMYLFDCPPEKGGRDMLYEVYFPCEKLIKSFGEKDVGDLKGLSLPVKMSFKYDPIITESEHNLYHFTLCFQDSNSCQYNRKKNTNSQQKFARIHACFYLRKVMRFKPQAPYCPWDKKNDKKLFKCSDVTKRYFRLHRRIWRWCCCKFSCIRSKISKKIICLCRTR